MKDHKLDEADEGKQWSIGKTAESPGKVYAAEPEEICGKVPDINAKIETLIRHSRIEGNMQQEIEILNAIKSGFEGRNVSALAGRQNSSR